MEVQYIYVHTRSNALSVSMCFHNPSSWTAGSLTCLHDLLTHAYTHVFAFIYSLRLNGCLFYGGVGEGGRGAGPFFFLFIRESIWAHFYEILEATLYGLLHGIKLHFTSWHWHDPAQLSGNTTAVHRAIAVNLPRISSLLEHCEIGDAQNMKKT